MAHKWTKEQRDKLSRTRKRDWARRKEAQNGAVPAEVVAKNKLLHLTANLLRALPDERLVELVK